MRNNRQKMYESLVKNYKVPHESIKNIIKSFFYGGLICLLGQILYVIFEKAGFDAKDASLLMSLSLIFLASLLTGLGVYDIIGKEAHAGTVIPITGFANSMTSSAIDYKSEGFILGIGTNIFKLAGVVIAASIISGFIVGVIVWLGGF